MTTGVPFQYADTTFGTSYSDFSYVKVNIEPNVPSLGDVTITSATLVPELGYIDYFPVGQTYSDGYASIYFDTETSGTLTVDGQLYTIQLDGNNQNAIVNIDETEYTYGLLSYGLNTLVLGQTDTDLTAEMNTQHFGPAPIWTLINTGSSASVDLSVMSGSITLYETDTENFGDYTNAVSYIVNFDTQTITDVLIDGSQIQESFTIVNGKIHVESSGNIHDITLLEANGGYYTFQESYSESWDWGTDAAQGFTTIYDYLANNSFYLWSDIDSGDYGKIIDNGNGTYTYENLSNGILESTSAVFIDPNTLVVQWENETASYSVAFNTIQATSIGEEIFTWTDTSIFNYTYTNEPIPQPEVLSYTYPVFETASIAAPMSDITEFPMGEVYNSLYASIHFDSTTTGTVLLYNQFNGTVTLENGAAVVRYTNSALEEVVQSYKMMGGTGDILVLGSMDTNLADDINQLVIPMMTLEREGSTQTPIALPQTGTMTLWNNTLTSGMVQVKKVLDFDTNTVIFYDVEGNIESELSMSVNGDVISYSIVHMPGMYVETQMTWVYDGNGVDVFDEVVSMHDNYPGGPAEGASDIYAYLAAHDNHIGGGYITGDLYTYDEVNYYPVTFDVDSITVTESFQSGGAYISTFSIDSSSDTIMVETQHVMESLASYSEVNPYTYTYHLVTSNYGTELDDTIAGTDHVDLTSGNGGDDTLGAGVDTMEDIFSYQLGWNEGNDTIQNFDASLDKIQLSTSQTEIDTNFEMYVTGIEAINGTDTIVTLSGGTTITLVGVLSTDVTAADFVGYAVP